MSKHSTDNMTENSGSNTAQLELNAQDSERIIIPYHIPRVLASFSHRAQTTVHHTTTAVHNSIMSDGDKPATVEIYNTEIHHNSPQKQLQNEAIYYICSFKLCASFQLQLILAEIDNNRFKIISAKHVLLNCYNYYSIQ